MNLNTLFDDDIIRNTEYLASAKASTPPVDTIEARTAEVTTTGAGDEALDRVDRPLTWRQVAMSAVDQAELVPNSRHSLQGVFNKAVRDHRFLPGPADYADQIALRYLNDRLASAYGKQVEITEFTVNDNGEFLVAGWRLAPAEVAYGGYTTSPNKPCCNDGIKLGTPAMDGNTGLLAGMGRAV